MKSRQATKGHSIVLLPTPIPDVGRPRRSEWRETTSLRWLCRPFATGSGTCFWARLFWDGTRSRWGRTMRAGGLEEVGGVGVVVDRQGPKGMQEDLFFRVFATQKAVTLPIWIKSRCKWQYAAATFAQSSARAGRLFKNANLARTGLATALAMWGLARQFWRA